MALKLLELKKHRSEKMKMRAEEHHCCVGEGNRDNCHWHTRCAQHGAVHDLPTDEKEAKDEELRSRDSGPTMKWKGRRGSTIGVGLRVRGALCWNGIQGAVVARISFCCSCMA